MIGSNRRQQVTDTVTRAVKSAGGLVSAALAVACVALVVSVVALVLAVRRPGIVADLTRA